MAAAPGESTFIIGEGWSCIPTRGDDLEDIVKGEVVVGWFCCVIGVELLESTLGNARPLSSTSCRWHTNKLQLRLLGEIIFLEPSVELGSCGENSFSTLS